MKTHILRWAFVLYAFALPTFSLLAQLPTPPPTPTPGTVMLSSPSSYPPPYAIITYPSADPTTQSQSVVSPAAGSIFALVGLQPDQAVQVTVQYPTDQAFQIVNLQALDGGTVLPPTVAPVNVPPIGSLPGAVIQPVSSLVISVDGTLSFTFQAAHNPGINQISLRQGSQALGLQFWVLDPQNPQNNPPAITPDNPNN